MGKGLKRSLNGHWTRNNLFLSVVVWGDLFQKKYIFSCPPPKKVISNLLNFAHIWQFQHKKVHFGALCVHFLHFCPPLQSFFPPPALHPKFWCWCHYCRVFCKMHQYQTFQLILPEHFSFYVTRGLLWTASSPLECPMDRLLVSVLCIYWSQLWKIQNAGNIHISSKVNPNLPDPFWGCSGSIWSQSHLWRLK